MINLLIAIDGTESSGYSRRWIEEFYNSFEVSSENGDASIKKYYNPGPYIYSLGERNCKEIYIDCTIWLARAIILHYSHFIKKKDENNLQIIRERELNKDKLIGKTAGYYNLFDILENFENSNKIKKFVNENIQISIVGHSRGGHVAIALNNSIPFKVFFLGLLDPVNKDITLDILDTYIIKKKYRHIFHAIRKKEFEQLSSQYRGTTFSTPLTNRMWFGYDGIDYEYKEDKNLITPYLTSHGGIGGSPFGHGFIPIVHDIASNQTYLDPLQKILLKLGNGDNFYSEKLHELNSFNPITSGYNNELKNSGMLEKLNKISERESNRVCTDFFNAAIAAGLKFTNK